MRRRLPYDGPDPGSRRGRGAKDFLPAARRNSQDAAFGDPWFIPEDDLGMGTLLGEDIAEDDLYMRMNRPGRRRRNPEGDIDRLERRALSGDPSAIRRLVEIVRGRRALEVEDAHAYCVRMRPEPNQYLRTDRAFFVQTYQDGRRREGFAASRDFVVNIDFEEVDPESGESTISRTRIDGAASAGVVEIRVDGKVAYRTRRPQ